MQARYTISIWKAYCIKRCITKKKSLGLRPIARPSADRSAFGRSVSSSKTKNLGPQSRILQFFNMRRFFAVCLPVCLYVCLSVCMYTPADTITHQYNKSTQQYTSVHISAHMYTSVHISTRGNCQVQRQRAKVKGPKSKSKGQTTTPTCKGKANRQKQSLSNAFQCSAKAQPMPAKPRLCQAQARQAKPRPARLYALSSRM